MGTWRVIAWGGSVVATALIAGSQISVGQAQSNLGGWLHLFGVDRLPGFVNKPVFDNVVALLALLYLAVMIADLLVRWWREARMARQSRH